MRLFMLPAFSLFVASICASVFGQSPTNPPGSGTRIKVAKPFPSGRTTPRETLETFCFAWDAIGKGIPNSIEIAESCLQLPEGATTGEKFKLVYFLGETIDLLSPPFVNVTANTKGDQAEASFDPAIPLKMERMKDGTWKFSLATLATISASHQKMIERNQSLQKQRAQMVEGQGDPTELNNTFLAHCQAGDFESAAQCLDLRGLPPSKRKTFGPLLAWKLIASMQRLGYIYGQDIPVDPVRPPYSWYSGPEGEVECQKIQIENQLDKWVFNQSTVSMIDSLWEKVKNREPNIRWQILGNVIPNPASDSLSSNNSNSPPLDLEARFSSPRQMIQGFLRSIDEAEHADQPLDEAAEYLDMSDFSLEDARRLGPKLAEKLEIILRKVKPPIQEMDDHWTAPQAVFGEKGFKVRIVRRVDGRWGFSSDTVSRIPTMFDLLTGAEKGQSSLKNVTHASPRDTFAAFMRAMNSGRLDEAAKCLDLEDIPATARQNLAPLLAIKLKLIINATGHVFFHEIPSDPDGPRYIWQRGPYARIILAKRADQSEAGWRFTDTTVAELDRGIIRLQKAIQEGESLSPEFYSSLPLWREAPGVRMYMVMPPSLSWFLGPLEIWQWIALAIFPMFLLLFYYLLIYIFDPIVYKILKITNHADRAPIQSPLKSIKFLFVMLFAYWILTFTNLPHLINVILSTSDDILLTIACVFSGFGMVDLIIFWSERTNKTRSIRGLQELLLPFFGRIIKTALVVGSFIYLVSCFDDGALLGRFLAGLGVIGLAVSLAAQDSLKNLFATMLLISDRNFSVGDLIKIGTQEGVVESVGFRSTIIKTKEDSLLIIPNALLANGTIDNLGVRSYRHVHGIFNLDPESSPENVAKLKEQAEDWLKHYPDIDKERSSISLHGISESGIALKYKSYILGKSREERDLREALTFKILEIAETNGIKLSKKT